MPFLQESTADQTPYYIINSGIAGNLCCFVGGTHGDEEAGYLAVEQARNFVPLKGSLLLVPKLCIDNVVNNRRKYPVGHAQYVALADPTESGDPNRYYPRPTDPDFTVDYAKSPLIKEFWQLILDENPFFVVDCHDSIEYHYFNSAYYGQTIIQYGNKSVGERIASNINNDMLSIDNMPPSEYTYKAYDRLFGGVAGSLARAVNYVWDSRVEENKVAYTFETASSSSEPGVITPVPVAEQVIYQLRSLKYALIESNIIENDPLSYIDSVSGNGNILLQYHAAGGLAPFDYIVEYKISNTWYQLYSGQDESILLTGIDNNAIYTFRVKARSSNISAFGIGYGNYSSESKFSGKNFFPDGAMGIVSATFNGVSLGKTFEETGLEYIEDIKDIIYKQDGTQPADKVITGKAYRVTLKMAEIEYEKLRDILRGLEISSTGKSALLTQDLYKSGLQNYAKELVLVRVDNINAPLTDDFYKAVFWKAFPDINSAIGSFSPENQRYVEVSFYIFYDDTNSGYWYTGYESSLGSLI